MTTDDTTAVTPPPAIDPAATRAPPPGSAASIEPPGSDTGGPEPQRFAGGSRLRRWLTPAPMMKVSLFFLESDAAEVVSVIARQGVCQVERLPKEAEDIFAPYFPEAFRDTFDRLRHRYDSLSHRWSHPAATAPRRSERPQVPSIDEMDRIASLLGQMADQAEENDRRRRQLDARRRELDHLHEYLRVVSELELGLYPLPEMRFLHVRVGTVPIENLERLQESAELSEDLVFELGDSGDRAHVMVVGAGRLSSAMEGLLTKAHFEASDPPASLIGGGGQTGERFQDEAAAIAAELEALAEAERRLRVAAQPVVAEAAQVLARASVFAQCDGTLGGRPPVAFLSGWVPGSKLDSLEQALQREVEHPVVVVAESPPNPDGDGQPPSEIELPGPLRAGAKLVSLYGTPGYNEIQPALILMATTPLMFGMMFGDVGHGLLLAVAAVAARRWLKQWWPMVLACGAGAVLFGFLYGSIFGVEHWLPSLWLRPLEEPMRLIAVALWAGVGFMLLSFALKALSLSVQGRAGEALLAFQGIAGATLYLGAVLMLRSVYLGEPVSLVAWLLAAVGFVLIGVHASRQVRAGGLSAAGELASDYFHGALTLLTNTLSFLRLAAFALAHGALSVALYLVIEMIPPTAPGWFFRVLVLLVGSIVILAIDLLAVGVQTVRLQFYEGLARYYRGDGRTHRPLRFPTTTAY